MKHISRYILLPLCMSISALIVSSCSSPKEDNLRQIETTNYQKFIEAYSYPDNEKTQKAFQESEELFSLLKKSDQFDHETISFSAYEYQKNTYIQQYQDIEVAKATTDELVQQYYDENMDDFKKEYRIATHVIFPYQHLMEENEKIVLQQKAQSIFSYLNSGSELAEIEGNIENYGKIFYSDPITRGQLPKNIEDSIFSEKSGNILPPIESQLGMHIVILESEIITDNKSIAEVKGKIKYKLAALAKKNLLVKLKNKEF